MYMDKNNVKVRLVWHLLRPVIVAIGRKELDKAVRCTAKQ